jgi:hypothetical protein
MLPGVLLILFITLETTVYSRLLFPVAKRIQLLIDIDCAKSYCFDQYYTPLYSTVVPSQSIPYSVQLQAQFDLFHSASTSLSLERLQYSSTFSANLPETYSMGDGQTETSVATAFYAYLHLPPALLNEEENQNQWQWQQEPHCKTWSGLYYYFFNSTASTTKNKNKVKKHHGWSS